MGRRNSSGITTVAISPGGRSSSRTYVAIVPETVPSRGSTTSGLRLSLNAFQAPAMPVAPLESATWIAWNLSPAIERT